MESEIVTSCDSVPNSDSNGVIPPDAAGPVKNNSTGPESQQTSTESAPTSDIGMHDRSNIAHNKTGLIVRIGDSPNALCALNPLENCGHMSPKGLKVPFLVGYRVPFRTVLPMLHQLRLEVHLVKSVDLVLQPLYSPLIQHKLNVL